MPDKRTIVIKIGSSLLVDEDTNKLRMNFLYHLMNDVAYYKEQGCKVVLVSSGSVALGRRYNTLENNQNLTLAQKQAAAATGQSALMAAYQFFAREHDIVIAQILITLHDFEDRKRFLNAEDTLEELLNQGTLPIVNENDTIATRNLRVGDNDRLAAKVAHLVEADDLVILTNVQGLYDQNDQVVPVIEEITDDIYKLAGGATGSGTGGMITKLQAAEIAAAAGCTTHITMGRRDAPVRSALDEHCPHTIITSGTTPENARHLWIATSLDIRGEITISKAALKRIQEGESIYPSDVKDMKGEFNRGDIISVLCEGKEVARGMSSFYAYEVDALRGKRNPDIFEILGYNADSDIIDENDLAIL